jgi:hypothetical protein
MIRLKCAVNQILFARNYTLDLVDSISSVDWYHMPSEGVTHIAWQVGHLAVAEYRLAIERIRGTKPSDDDLIPRHFLKLFGKGSTVTGDPGDYPGPDEIRTVLDHVHVASLKELQKLPLTELDRPPVSPHPLAKTKLDALNFCGQHEMLHAGQIGLLRRLLGYKPLR